MCGKALTTCAQWGYEQGHPLAWNVHGKSLNLGWDVHVTWDILPCPQCPSRRSHLLLRCKTQAHLFHSGESTNQGLNLSKCGDWCWMDCESVGALPVKIGSMEENMMKVPHSKGENIENMGACIHPCSLRCPCCTPQ